MAGRNHRVMKNQKLASKISIFTTIITLSGMLLLWIVIAYNTESMVKDHITSQMRVLSGGENAKVRLAMVMNREHNWLVLDEPTNHLDVDAKEELKRALTQYPGTILLVSHEPSFYEDFVTDIWNVEDWTTKIV